MGKALRYFLNGFPGAISRAVDDIVISIANKETTNPIAFGEAVFINSAGTGAIKYAEGTTAFESQFIGIAVRSASKTPDAYDPDPVTRRNEGSYQPREIMDVITRGRVVVRADSATRGWPVYFIPSTGHFTKSAGTSPNTNILVPNAHFGSGADTGGCAEIVLNERNVL